MTTSAASAVSGATTRWRRLAWRHPHWWAVVLCAAVWVLLIARWWRGAHIHGFALIDWALMIVAMMLPLVFDHLRVAAARSLWPRRHRAMLGFLCGYAAIWLLVGVALSIVMAAIGIVPHLMPHGAGGSSWTAAAFVGAAAWQLSPLKRRALIACHRTVPLAPHGWRAHRDCVRYGWIIGCSCLMSCALLMLACALAGHSLPAMLAATGVAGAERVSARADAWTTSVVLALVAMGTLVAT